MCPFCLQKITYWRSNCPFSNELVRNKFERTEDMNKERTELNKELKVIDFYCKKCKKSMKVSYMVTGNKNYPVLPRVIMKCHHCGRVMTLKNFKEGELLDKVEEDKYYI